MDVAILFALILLNGAFAMSEIALVAARKGRLQPLAEQRDAGALAALRPARGADAVSFPRCRSASRRSAS
jgi:CBS domain containing-hemolysin-like protein